jgi:hypothetical protein
MAVDSRWLTSTAVSLAQTIYEERDLDRLPTLAEALEGSGCDQSELAADLAVELAHGPAAAERFCFVELPGGGLVDRKQPDIMRTGQGKTGERRVRCFGAGFFRRCLNNLRMGPCLVELPHLGEVDDT